jgi:hypothetical protein
MERERDPGVAWRVLFGRKVWPLSADRPEREPARDEPATVRTAALKLSSASVSLAKA